MKNKTTFRIRVFEIPKDQTGIYGFLDDGSHLDKLAFGGVHGFTLVEDREEGLVPVAITIFSLKEDCLSIEWFYVSEEHRNLGYGERLLYECFKAAKQEGKSHVQLLLTDDMLYMSDYLYDIGFSPIDALFEWRFDGSIIPDDIQVPKDVPLKQCVGLDTLSVKDKSRIVKELSAQMGSIIYNAGAKWLGEDEAGCYLKQGGGIRGMLQFVKIKKTWLCTMAAAQEEEEAEAMIIYTLDKLLDKIKVGEDICLTGIDENISDTLERILEKRVKKTLYVFSASTDIIGG